MIARVACSKHPILLLGESGAGKSAVARVIHSLGSSPERAFLEVDCATAGASLAEGDWFRSKDGSPAGTLFLREIWALPPLAQAKLVRHFQEREIGVADDGKAGAAEARIIGASSRDLELAVQQSTFRRDLFRFLNVVCLQMPALRDRKDDIGPLAEHFLARMSTSKGLRYSFTADAEKALLIHDWPGNVAELKECVECAVAACATPMLRVEDLPIQRGSSSEGESFADASRILPLAEVEKQQILRALERLNGDKVTAARLLGIGKTTLYRKLKEYGISEPWISRPEPNR
jgi:two-component system response regulator HydG